MKPRSFATLLAVVGFAATLGPRVAAAAEQSCSSVAIEPDAAFRDGFPDLLARIRSELSARSDIDACARVELRLDPVAVFGVSVTLPDGRAASRSVTRRDDVIPTLQALLLVPEHAPEPPAAPPASAPPPPHPSTRITSEPQAHDTAPTPPALPRQLGCELSFISGARIGDGQYAYGAGALAFLEVKSWLFGFEGRADGYRSLSGGDPETALELALLAGKRLDFGGVALDLSAGPAVAMKGVALSQTESVAASSMSPANPPPPPPPHSEASSGAVPRLLIGARLGFSPHSIFRTFVGLDGEWGPSRAPRAPGDTVASPRMPTFSIGLALGATVGTP